MRRRLVALSILIGLATPAHALTGIQQIVGIAGMRAGRVPGYTLASYQASMAGVASTYHGSSGGLYELQIVGVFGFFVVPADTPCRADLYGGLLEDAAFAAGVTLPPGSSPWLLWDCGHQETMYRPTHAGLRMGIITDGKEMAKFFGETVGFPVATAEVLPAVGSNAFDPYTVMGYLGTPTFNAWERYRKGWLDPSLTVFDDTAMPSQGTRFIEALEVPATSQLKLWRLSNLILIETRRVARGVTLHLNDTLLDLDPVQLCRQYWLPVGEVYTRGDGIGVRVDSYVADKSGISGAWVTVLPYVGAATSRCPAGTTK